MFPITVIPFFQLASCNTESKTKTFALEFNGTNCTINGEHSFTKDIEEGKAISYVVIPDSYCVLPKEPIFPLPDGVVWNYEISSLIIANMDKPYTINFQGIPTTNFFTFDYDDQDLTATIMSYSGDETNLKIPETVVYDNKTYTITGIGNSAFYNQDYLVSVDIPNTIKTIGDSAFDNCSYLKSINIGNSVTTIGKRAFQYCEKLQSISMPDSVMTIGEEAFLECSKLESAKISNSVKSIENKTFYNCVVLSEVSLPESLESIGKSAFEKDSELVSFEIPNKVTEIGERAFYGCNNILQLVFPNSINLIGESAFSTCNKLQSIIFNNPNTHSESTETIIGNGAFLDCQNLSSIEFSNSITKLDDSSFKGCKNLISVSIPDSTTEIGSCTFMNCENLTSITIGNGINIIKASAFSNCSNLTYVSIGKSIKEIGPSAFSSCSALSDHSAPDGGPGFRCSGSATDWIMTNRANDWHMPSVTHIKCADATIPLDAVPDQNLEFSYNDANMEATVTGISEQHAVVYLPKTVEHDGKSYTITRIGTMAFNNDDVLEFIFIPNTVTHIEQQAFQYCNSLHSIDIPNSVTSIDYEVFLGSGLQSVVLPKSVHSISKRAFNDCDDLKSVTIPNTVKSIGEYAFANCSDLTDTSGPNDRPGIHFDGNYWDFIAIDRESDWLKDTPEDYIRCNDFDMLWNDKPDDNLEYDYNGDKTAFVKGNGHHEESKIYIPKTVAHDGNSYTVTRIENSAFYENDDVEKFLFPDSITEFGESSFGKCTSLKSIIIPASVKNFEDMAFVECDSLKDIYLKHETPPTLGSMVFAGCPEDKTFHIKQGTKQLYLEADGWKEFSESHFIEDQN